MIDVNRSVVSVAVILAITMLGGCSPGPRGGPRVATIPIRGIVLVDGKPAATLRVECHPATANPSVPAAAALTGEDGIFQIGTYEGSDGAPEGEYRLTFVWGEYNLMNGQYGGDKLNKKYADPEESEVKVSVKNKPIDLGEIQLTTK